jgi:hypothetical protein
VIYGITSNQKTYVQKGYNQQKKEEVYRIFSWRKSLPAIHVIVHKYPECIRSSKNLTEEQVMQMTNAQKISTDTYGQ